MRQSIRKYSADFTELITKRENKTYVVYVTMKSGYVISLIEYECIKAAGVIAFENIETLRIWHREQIADRYIVEPETFMSP